MNRRSTSAGPRTGPLLVLTLVGLLAATTACSSGESSGDEGDAADERANEPDGPVPGADVAQPTVTGPITGGTHGEQFNAMPTGLADRYGYVEEEYFIEGEATAYQPEGELQRGRALGASPRPARRRTGRASSSAAPPMPTTSTAPSSSSGST